MRAKNNGPRLDRFATHRWLVEQLPALKRATGGDAAGLLAIVLWDMADGRTGEVRGATVSRLAVKAAMDRKTVRQALAALEAAVIIEPLRDAGGAAVEAAYKVNHCEKGDDD